MNNTNYVTRTLAIAAAVIALGMPAMAQLNTSMMLTISDNNEGPVPGKDTLYLGFNPAATNGRDANLGEEEQPPVAPEGVFDARWVNVGSSSDFGQGVKKNYHAYKEATQRDTFRLKVQPYFAGGQDGYPLTISWSDMKPYFQEASLRFVDGDGNPTTQDMLTATSFQFSNASSSNSTVTIFTMGPKDPASSVDNERSEKSTRLMLSSTPNPVYGDRGMNISYELASATTVSLNIYNALGQLVRTVISNEPQAAMRHSISVNVSGMAPGSYYYTIAAGEIMASRRFVLVD